MLWKRLSLLEQLQPCRIFHKHRVSLESARAIQTWNPWIMMGVTINSLSTRRQAGAEYLLLDSGAQLHACRITYPGQKIPLPDPGIRTASGARLQHDGGMTGDIQTCRRTNNSSAFSTRVAVQKPILSLGCLAQQGVLE